MGWLELIGTPSDGILHRPDCTWLCCLLSQLHKKEYAPERISPNCASTCFLMLLWFPPRGFGLLAGLSLSAHGFHPSHIGLGIRYFFLN